MPATPARASGRHAGQCQQHPDGRGAQEGADHSPAQHEEPQEGAGQHRDLPELAEGSPRGMAEPAMAPIAAGPAPVRKDWTAGLARNRSKCRPPTRTKGNEGAKATTAASSPPPTPAGRIADDRDGLDHRIRG